LDFIQILLILKSYLKYDEDGRATAQKHAVSAGPPHLGPNVSKEIVSREKIGQGLMRKTALVNSQ
jgi:hypothetical protein